MKGGIMEFGQACGITVLLIALGVFLGLVLKALLLAAVCPRGQYGFWKRLRMVL